MRSSPVQTASVPELCSSLRDDRQTTPLPPDLVNPGAPQTSKPFAASGGQEDAAAFLAGRQSTHRPSTRAPGALPPCPGPARALSPGPTHSLTSAITTVLSIATCTARALQASKTASFLPGRGGEGAPMSLPGSSLLASASRGCAGEVARAAVPNQASTRARVRRQAQALPSLRQPGHPNQPRLRPARR